MVRCYKKKSNRRSTYDETTLQRALAEIRRGVITQYGAHKKFGIPQMTLSYHRRGIRGKKSSSMGRSTAIPINEEAKLAECLITMEKWGWGLTRRDIFNTVEQYVTRNKLKTPFKNGRPGEDWFLGFSKRHNLSIKKPQSVEYARKKCLDPFIIRNYFDILKKQLDDLSLHDKPRQIWNLDETSFSLDPSKTKIVGKRGAPSSRTTAGSGRENTTVLMAVSADGFKAPPLIVFKAKNMWDDWVAPRTDEFPGTSYAVTANGWMESQLFLNYFEKILLEVLGPDRPILLIYDGHVSHVDDRLIKVARDNRVTILKLPPHSSHILQPLDLSVFKSLKVKWDQTLVHWQRHNEGRKLPKKKFSSLVGQIWKETEPDIIRNGFKKGGIHPFDSNVVTKDKYDPAAYKRWEEQQRDPDQDLNNNQSHSPQPGPSGVNVENQLEKPVDFQELLLATVKQSNPTEKVKKRRVAKGAEVITSDTVQSLMERNKSKNFEEEENHKKIGKSSGENIVFDDSDDDIEEEIREIEELDACMTEMDKPVTDIEKDDWVLVALSGKKSKKCYVGQVISAEKGEEELEIKFTKKVPSLDPLTCSTFAWKCPDECALIAREDITLTLPKPTFTKRGLIRFELNFSAYNIQ